MRSARHVQNSIHFYSVLSKWIEKVKQEKVKHSRLKYGAMTAVALEACDFWKTPESPAFTNLHFVLTSSVIFWGNVEVEVKTSIKVDLKKPFAKTVWLRWLILSFGVSVTSHHARSDRVLKLLAHVSVLSCMAFWEHLVVAGRSRGCVVEVGQGKCVWGGGTGGTGRVSPCLKHCPASRGAAWKPARELKDLSSGGVWPLRSAHCATSQ